MTKSERKAVINHSKKNKAQKKYDKKRKKDIEDLDLNESREILNSLRPKRYKYKNDELETTRWGFIAQEVTLPKEKKIGFIM